jgi:hypothetical protein
MPWTGRCIVLRSLALGGFSKLFPRYTWWSYLSNFLPWTSREAPGRAESPGTGAPSRSRHMFDHLTSCPNQPAQPRQPLEGLLPLLAEPGTSLLHKRRECKGHTSVLSLGQGLKIGLRRYISTRFCQGGGTSSDLGNQGRFS